ncbi:putative Hvp 101 VSH-1 tail protein [Brachyspira intermedia PWS/A]|uniref:Putative Hvp 101 VSH-1 tail protein n=1 Tax=Brachyspira intermedia (strain ATCC 51140 / PWS/A) TaxID=1045858 RepID=G0EPM7_BRAIP|nr:hypothetical protein [Brachyspira intermedia]AEM20741.1 putative Hvp 101 VSH-1 tail protein [Brachyspira intermedia PWS/A]
MSGLYPVDQDINIFGEIIKFPSMGSDGKFTNGDFTDPKKPASFIPAETINLIIDNLNNLIKYCGLEPNNTSETQLKEAIDKLILNKSCPIGSTYIQFAEDDGTFDASKSPEKLFGGTWQLKYNTESVFFRTEGSLSEEGRSNGIQQDAMQKLTGTIHTYNTQNHKIIMDGTGCFSIESGGGYGSNSDTGLLQVSQGVKFDNSKRARTSTENRTKNRKIRIYKRIA